jgi:ubiquinone/menaquinone biosynthesis C-methylase UbiE
MKSGSSYETYEKTHSDYDKTRLAVGNEQLVTMLAPDLGPDRRANLRILDAGCGTGVHLSAFAAAGFSNLTGLDASVTGLAQAAAKLKTSEVKLICGDIRQMPFAAGSFDLVLFSFVIHHLPHTNEAALIAATRSLLASSADLLVPGGRLAIITCTPEQLSADSGCMWYYKYFAEASARLAARFLSPTVVGDALTAAGLEAVQCEPVEQTYWTDASLDATGPFDSTWRSGDSLFALCAQEPDKFAAQLATLQNDIDSGAAAEHIAAVRLRAETVKQATIITAMKKR